VQALKFSLGVVMKSTTIRKRTASDTPRVNQIKKLPRRTGRLKVADIRKAVDAVVRERLAVEAAQHATEAAE
jgi:hypothetical protein